MKNFYFFLFLFFFIILILNTKAQNILNCTPNGVRLSFGDYYKYHSETNENNSILINILYETIDLCEFSKINFDNNTQQKSIDKIDIYKNDNTSIYINHFSIKAKEGNKYFNKKFNYSIFITTKEKDNSNSFYLPSRDPIDDSNFESTVLFLGMIDKSTISNFTIESIKRRVNSEKIDSIIFLGNLAYNLSSENGIKGIEFINFISDFASKCPLLTTPGLNEKNDDYKFYDTFFQSNVSERNYYSLNLGYLHLVQINMVEFLLNSTLREEIFAWMDVDLTNTFNNQSINWRVIYGYYPLYCSSPICKELLLNKSNQYFEEYMYYYYVDIYISSHLPIYERTSPIYSSKMDFVLNPKNMSNNLKTIYIVEGVGGNQFDTYNSKYNQSSYSLFLDTKIGYGKLTVKNKSCIHYVHYSSIDDKIIDQFYIFKDPPLTYEEKKEFLLVSTLYVVFGIFFVIGFQIYVDKQMT